jgi:pimeloyl-ACP methyl ester carboxylesterase
MTSEVLPLLRIFRQEDLPIPTLYIMGEEDYMFLPAVQKVVSLHPSASLEILPNCGHVVNVEKPKLFNDTMLQFITPNLS